MKHAKVGLKQDISKLRAPRIAFDITEELVTTYTVEVYSEALGCREVYLMPSNLSAAVFTDRDTAEKVLASIV